MAIIMLDGFDFCSNAADVALLGYNNAGPTSASTGRLGTSRCLQMTSSNSNVTAKGLPGGAINSLSVGFAMQADNFGQRSATGDKLITFQAAGSQICSLGLNHLGQLRFGRTDFSGNLIVASDPGIVKLNVWHYIEIELVRATGSSGSVNVYLDGILVAALASTNTGSAAIDAIGFSSGVGNVNYDDLYVVNAATRLGECRVETIRPTSDTATKDFTRSAGSDNYLLVDDPTNDSDSTYNQSGTVGHKDLFGMGNLTGSPTVKAVSPVFFARKDDATARTVRSYMVSGATTQNQTTRGMTTSYAAFQELYELNPDGSVAWDATSVNALQVGYEVVS
jgi:hypothetical protein